MAFAAKNTILRYFATIWKFLWKKSFWINSEYKTTSAYQVWKVTDSMLSKLYHLLQITLLQHFAATPSFLLFYCYKASPNAQLALYSKIGSNCCNIFEVIPFAANDTVLQHFQQLEKNCKKNLSESI